MIYEYERVLRAAGPTMGAMHRYFYLWDASLTHSLISFTEANERERKSKQ